jgi:hypothetical protein
MLHRVGLVRTDVSEECVASIFRVARIGKLGTMLAVTSNRSTLRHFPPKRQFLQEPHGVIPEDDILNNEVAGAHACRAYTQACAPARNLMYPTADPTKNTPKLVEFAPYSRQYIR